MADYDFGQGLKGAGGGAMAGFSVGGPVGALIGGGLGLLGGFGGGESEAEKQQRARLEALYAQMGQGGPQAGPAAQGAYSSFRNNQSGLISRLEALSQGQGPSLAAQQFREATDRNQAAQASMANSGRGGPMAAFQAANNSALLGAQAAQGSAAARIQEQQMALNQLGLTLHGARGADEDMNRFNAGQQNFMSQANLNAAMQNQANRLQVLGMLGGQNAQTQNRPGLGDQILAGGAGFSSWYSGNQALNRGMGGVPTQGSPMDALGQYRRNPDGSLGPITSTQGL